MTRISAVIGALLLAFSFQAMAETRIRILPAMRPRCVMRRKLPVN